MVKLVHDNNVEVCGIEIADARRVQALDRSENVFEVLGRIPSDPELPERMVAKRMAKRCEALSKDLFAMGDEEETRAGQGRSKARVVDGGHDRLAGARRSHEEVPVMTE